MEKCKTLEKKIELLIELFKIWALFILAWSTALGTLVYKASDRKDLLIFSTFGLVTFSITWIIIFTLLWKLINKLDYCKGE